MVNRIRGEVEIEVEGERIVLCLTLGALAEIETGLDCAGLDAVAARLRQPTAGDLQRVLAALIRGGGRRDIAETLHQRAIQPVQAAQAIAEAFQLAVAP